MTVTRALFLRVDPARSRKRQPDTTLRMIAFLCGICVAPHDEPAWADLFGNLLDHPYSLSQGKLSARVLLTSCLESRTCHEKEARGGNDLLDVLIAPVPFLNLVIGGLDGIRGELLRRQ